MDADRRTGRLVGGHWRLGAPIGEGATSTVYAATHRSTGQRGAVKILRASLAGDAELAQRFLAEGYLVNAIEHPGVVKVFEDGVTEDGCPFLVLELLVGHTLDELRQMHGGRIPLDEVMRIADGMMDTLAAVHDVGVIHRDLKPQNVMVLEGGGVKLLDFGLAKVRGRTADAAESVVGTPSFMPPEQALGLTKKMDAQSDIWALGATLFQVLSGQPVHVAKHMTAMILASASTRPRSLADAAPELPREVAQVIDRAIAYRKADRWPDVRTMRSHWQAAHPSWLPTLPPPSFASAPVSAPRASTRTITTPLAMTMFDPRELFAELEPEAPPIVPVSERAARPSAATRMPRASWGSIVALAATAAIMVGLVTAAVVLAADDRPARVASPPPSVMELPPPKPRR